MNDFSFSIESELGYVPKNLVWKHITQMKNVNAELSPFIHMTFPKDRTEISDALIVPTNTVLFTSVLLLFRWIPIDLHFLCLDRVEEGTAFYENSYTLLNRYWKHTRILTERMGKVYVLDDVHFSPRLPLIGYFLLPVIRYIFKNRHHNLKASLGVP